MIGLCTDSNVQLPPLIVDRFAVEVVPFTVTIDDVEYLEGVDLDPDSFYRMFTADRRPDVRCGQPSAGQFAAAYDNLAERGCSQILSIHTSSDACASLPAARLAAHCAPVPVRLLDTSTARFGVRCCVWAAGDAIAAGATADEVVAVADSVRSTIRNVFIVAALDLAGGERRDTRQPVLTIDDGQVRELDRVGSVVDAVNAMAGHVVRGGRALKVTVGSAHRDTLPIAEALAHALGESAAVSEVVHYRIGPSGAENGPGTVGVVMFPSPTVGRRPVVRL